MCNLDGAKQRFDSSLSLSMRPRRVQQEQAARKANAFRGSSRNRTLYAITHCTLPDAAVLRCGSPQNNLNRLPTAPRFGCWILERCHEQSLQALIAFRRQLAPLEPDERVYHAHTWLGCWYTAGCFSLTNCFGHKVPVKPFRMPASVTTKPSPSPFRIKRLRQRSQVSSLTASRASHTRTSCNECLGGQREGGPTHGSSRQQHLHLHGTSGRLSSSTGS